MVTSDTGVGSQLLLCTSVAFTAFILAEKKKEPAQTPQKSPDHSRKFET